MQITFILIFLNFYIMQIAYTDEFGRLRSLNDIVREFP